MELAALVAVTVLLVLAVMAGAGYVIEKSADAHEPGVGRRSGGPSGPPRPG